MENIPLLDEQKDLLASFDPSPAQTGTKPQELDPDIEVKPAIPKINEPIDMIKKTAARISESRVLNVTAKARLKRDYEKRIGSSVANKESFYGSGTEEVGSELEE